MCIYKAFQSNPIQPCLCTITAQLLYGRLNQYTQTKPEKLAFVHQILNSILSKLLSLNSARKIDLLSFN